MNIRNTLMATLFAFLFSSCASIVDGGLTENIAINTNPSGINFVVKDS